MSDIVKRLRDQAMSDHARGCEGRQYSCECGYDIDTERLLAKAADRIERLEAALRACKHGAEYCDELGDIIDAALAPESK